MIISVASGKGGTGKTTVAVNLALSLAEDKENKITFMDCDVEEPNAHIFLNPIITNTVEVGIPVPEIEQNQCNLCGYCAEVCVYNALAVTKNQVLVFPGLCHGCGACMLLCPQKAIIERRNRIGVIEEGQSNQINFIHGRLNIGEPMAPPIIREIKKKCLKNDQKNHTITIIDAPPGTSCPVIESIKDSDFTILVTEPTPFGFHDLVLAVEVLEKIKIPYGIVINKYGIGNTMVEEYCHHHHIPVLLNIPMDKEIAVAYSKGISIVNISLKYKQEFRKLFTEISKHLKR